MKQLRARQGSLSKGQGLPLQISFPGRKQSGLGEQKGRMEQVNGDVMETTLSAYRQLGPKRYRETSGLYYEDFEIGDTFEHRPGRTILDVDNTWFTLLTMNIQELHFDAAYAEKTEWKKPLVDSTLTLALLTGMSVRTVSAKVVANLGW